MGNKLQKAMVDALGELCQLFKMVARTSGCLLWALWAETWMQFLALGSKLTSQKKIKKLSQALHAQLKSLDSDFRRIQSKSPLKQDGKRSVPSPATKQKFCELKAFYEQFENFSLPSD